MDIFKEQDILVGSLNANKDRLADDPLLQNDDSLCEQTIPAAQPQPYQPQFVPLPNDVTPANFTLPQTRSDILEIQDRLFRLSCVALGCPPELLLPSRGRSAASDEQTMLLDYTLLESRELLERLLIDMYSLFFGIDDNIGITFPALLRPTFMAGLYDAGMLTYDAYKNFIVEHSRINIDSLETEQPASGLDGGPSTIHTSEGEHAVVGPKGNNGDVAGTADNNARTNVQNNRTTTSQDAQHAPESAHQDSENGTRNRKQYYSLPAEKYWGLKRSRSEDRTGERRRLLHSLQRHT